MRYKWVVQDRDSRMIRGVFSNRRKAMRTVEEVKRDEGKVCEIRKFPLNQRV